MKIKKLIEIFEKCLKNYQKGYNKKYNYTDLIDNRLNLGICYHCEKKLTSSLIYHLFNNGNGYYSKLCIGNTKYLFPTPNLYEELLPRINWLKKEIKDLNKLLKKGYTEV